MSRMDVEILGIRRLTINRPGRPMMIWMLHTLLRRRFDYNEHSQLFQWLLNNPEDTSDYFEMQIGQRGFYVDMYQSVFSRNAFSQVQLFHLFKKNFREDVNSTNIAGRTPLLQSLYFDAPDTIKAVKLLLNDGADPRATDHDGNGVLHALLMPTDDKVSFDKVPYHRIQSIYEACGLFLQIGCDPSLPNHLGYTPSDLAMSKPSLWFVWCVLLEKAGFDVAEMLRKEDQRRGIQEQPPHFCLERVRVDGAAHSLADNLGFNLGDEVECEYLEKEDPGTEPWKQPDTKHPADDKLEAKMVRVDFEAEILVHGFDAANECEGQYRTSRTKEQCFPFNVWSQIYVRHRKLGITRFHVYQVPAVQNSTTHAPEDAKKQNATHFHAFFKQKREHMLRTRPGHPSACGRMNWKDFSDRKWCAYELYQPMRNDIDGYIRDPVSRPGALYAKRFYLYFLGCQGFEIRYSSHCVTQDD